MIHATEADVGRFVVYHAAGQPAEAGRIRDIRGDTIFVAFPKAYITGSLPLGCDSASLTWLDDLVEQPTPPTEPELAVIAERHAASTEGEWRVYGSTGSLRKIEVVTETSTYDGQNPVQRRNLMAENGCTEEDMQFVAAIHQDVPRLLAREALLVNVIHDLQQESAMLEQGRREVLGVALAAMDAVIEERRRAAKNLTTYQERKILEEQANAVTRARNLLAEKLADLTPADSLPPDQVRAENIRLRAVLRQIANPAGVLNYRELQQTAREVLGEKEPS